MQTATPDGLAEEVPIAVSYAGIAYAVMMGTPADLEDFSVGFSITEGIVGAAEEVRGISVRETDAGAAVAVDLALSPESLHRFLARHRVRGLHGHTSCGICGVRDLQELPAATGLSVAGEPPSEAAIGRAVRDIRDHQPLARLTHASHAAAWADGDGAIRLVREDVGRHVALDKLIGGLARRGGMQRRGAGFCLVTSRCSYEMVQKSVVAGFGALVTLSAPTALAMRTAAAAGLWLRTDAARKVAAMSG